MLDVSNFTEDTGEIVDRLSMRTYNENRERIYEWDESKGSLTLGACEQNELGEWVMTQIYHPYSEQELKDIQIEKDKAVLEESRKPFTLDEVTAIFMKAQLNTVDIPDQQSLRMMDYYPTFDEIIGSTVKMGYKFTYEGKMYKTIQPETTIQEQYEPRQGMESLYTRIDIEHTGLVYDPIPYEGNLELLKGNYYTQDEVLYLCVRNTEAPVYQSLKDLIGLYVEIV